MGQSTDAYLYYGYTWTEESEDLDFEPSMDDWAEKKLKADGHTDPWDNYPENVDRATSDKWMRDNDAAIGRWSDMKKELQEATGVDWNSHCSGEYPMPFLHVRGTHVTAWRGSPKAITSIEVGDGWKAKLDAFLEAEGIEPPEGENQPGWWLASNWG